MTFRVGSCLEALGLSLSRSPVILADSSSCFTQSARIPKPLTLYKTHDLIAVSVEPARVPAEDAHGEPFREVAGEGCQK
jgi:hypothetical protein